MDEGQRSELVQWFLPQLEQAWDDELTGSAQVLGQRYVQWAGHGIGLQVECSSNRVLTGADRLPPHQAAQLGHLGWNPPSGDDLPNHWRVFFDREGLLDAAHALVDAVEVLRVPAFVPTPAPSAEPPEPAAAQPGRCCVVVPVVRVDAVEVARARDAAVEALGACVVVDHGHGPLVRLPVHPFADVVAWPVPLVSAVTVKTGPAVQTAGPVIAARTLGTALERVHRLLRRGMDVVLVLPDLPLDLRWLYGAVLADVDAVVLVLAPEEDGHQSWATVLDVVRPLAGGPLLLGVASALEGSVLRAVGTLRAVVSERDPALRATALTTLLEREWDGHAPREWQTPALRQALLRADLLPLLARLEALPRRLTCTHDVAAALDLLDHLLHAVQEHLEHLQGVGLDALGRLHDLFGLLADAGRRGVPGADRAAGPLSWLAECGASSAEGLRQAAAAVGRTSGRPGVGPGADLGALLEDLQVEAPVRDVVQALAAEHALVADRRSDYVSLRPAGGGAVAVYVHRALVALALPPAVAQQLAPSLPSAGLEHGSGTTTYLRVPAAEASAQPEVVVDACRRAVAFRAQKPSALP